MSNATDSTNPNGGTDASVAGDVVEHGEVVSVDRDEAAGETETINAPAKVMRIGSMVRQLLEEVRSADLDEASRERLGEIFERSIAELSGALSPDLQHELHMLALPFTEGTVPSVGEIRVAHAQLVGWLEGLFHGIQATLFAQQMAARQQLDQMRGLPPGSDGPMMDPRLAGMQQPGREGSDGVNDRPGTYL